MKHLSVTLATTLALGLGSAHTVWAQDADPETQHPSSTIIADASIFPDYDTMFDRSEFSEAELAELDAFVTQQQTLNATLTPKTGEITLGDAGAVLDLGDDYYYLDRTDAKRILVEEWGNHPEIAASSLGMIFPRGTDSTSNVYAINLTFDDIGYVSDEEASDLDYGALLKDMQKASRDANRQLAEEGYPTVDLLGWASEPRYDAAAHRLSWAKRLQFQGSEGETLNYNVRFLGRRGVLEFNYIADATALDELESDLPSMMSLAAFKDGHRYTDFNPDTDKVAAVGVAGLIAGAAVAKKTGLIALLILFLKKGWIFVVAAIAFGWRFLKGMFAKDREPVPAVDTTPPSA